MQLLRENDPARDHAEFFSPVLAQSPADAQVRRFHALNACRVVCPTSASTPPDAAPDRARLWGLCGLGLLFAVLTWASAGTYPVGSANDDAQYILQARELATRYGFLPQFGFLPGYPIFLVPFVWVFGDSIVALQAATTMAMIATAVVLEAIARRYLPSPQSLLIAAVFLLNPVALAYGTTCMSDPFGALLATLAVYLTQRVTETAPGDPPCGALALGALLAFGATVRVANVVLAAALIVVLLLRRRFRALAEAALGAALMAVVLFPIYAIIFRALDKPMQESLWAVWWQTLPALLGEHFMGLAPVATAAGVVLLLLALAGGVRLLAERGPQAVVAALVVHVLFQSTWPYHEVRYWLVAWPWLALLAAWALPPRARPVLLVLLVVAAVPADVALIRSSQESLALMPQREASRAWLRAHAGPRDVIGTQHGGFRARLLIGREVGSPAEETTFAAYMAGMCAARARFILEEPQEVGVTRLDGVARQPFARPDLWLDASSLVRRVHHTPWDRVYEVLVPPGVYLSAFRHYVVALQSEDAATAEAELTLALTQVPDFPDAAVALAARMARDPARRERAEKTLQNVLRRYPMHFDAVVLLAGLWTEDGRRDDAVRLLDQGTQIARELGQPAAVRRLELEKARIMDSTK